MEITGMAVDLPLLRVFLAVYDTRSVSRAALALDMSQPGLSTALRRLREALGDPLFVKTSGGMEPTSRARDICPHVRDVLHTIDKQLVAVPEFDPATSTREFRLALSDIGEGIYLPIAIRSIQEHAPSVSLRSVFMPPRDLEEAMAAGEVDMAAGYFPDIKTGEFLHRRVGFHSFTCIMRADHPVQAERLTLEQYMALDHIKIEAAGRSQEVFELFLRKKKLQPRVILSTPHFMSVPVIVGSTDAVATVPQALADFMSGMPEIRQVKLPFLPPVFQVNLYWHRSAQNDPANRWLREVFAEQFHTLRARRYDRHGRSEQAA
jgi:DNA-binding transcriptional LysR family regulator